MHGEEVQHSRHAARTSSRLGGEARGPSTPLNTNDSKGKLEASRILESSAPDRGYLGGLCLGLHFDLRVTKQNAF